MNLIKRASASVLSWYSPSRLLTLVVVGLSLLLILSAIVASYFGMDAIASLFYVTVDTHCLGDDPTWSGVGAHCFGDYYQVVSFAFHPNPWDVGSNYPPSGMLPQAGFGFVGWLLDSPRIGLVLYLATCAAALMVPAFWATRGQSPTARLAAAGLLGVVSIPAISVLDRGNAVALVVPAILAYLVSLRRGNYTAVMIAVVIAALVKPQFVILLVALLAARKWRQALIGAGLIVLTNLIPYLFWPKEFPATLVQSVINALRFGRSNTLATDYPPNVSFGKGIYEFDHVVRSIFGLNENQWLASSGGVIGMAVAAGAILLIWIVGRSVPAIVGGIVLAACASMFPGTTYSYYLVFALAVAAVAIRDPLHQDGRVLRGSFDAPGSNRASAFAFGALALATALSLTRVLIPVTTTVELDGQLRRDDILLTLAAIVPLAWMVAIIAVFVAWWPTRGRRIAAVETHEDEEHAAER
jgi:hypothetical protein